MLELRNCLIAAATVAPMLASTAWAGNIASAPVYGGAPQNEFICYLYNGGSTAAALSGLKIVDQMGSTQKLTGNSCGTSLPAGAGCNYVEAVGFAAHVCRATISGSAALIRGSAAARGATGGDIASTPIR